MVGPGIVVGATRYLGEAGAAVKPEGRIIVLVNFQKYRTRTKTGKPAHMKAEEVARESATTLPPVYRDGKDLRFILNQPRHYKPAEFRADHRAVREDVPVEQQPFDLLLTPAAPE